MKEPKTLLFLLILILFIGCDNNTHKAGDVVNREGEPPVQLVDGKDEEMNKAIEKARQSVEQFINSLQNPMDGQTYFSIKARFSEGKKIEHIWLSDVKFDGREFHGKIGNEPLDLKNLSFGDHVTVLPTEISDWMIIENNKLKGGYTLRVFRKRMSAEERKRFDKEIGFTIE